MIAEQSKDLNVQKPISRKAFLLKAGRLSLLLSLLGLGGFLFKRNTCSGSSDATGRRTTLCSQCGVHADCSLTQARQYRTSSRHVGKGE